PSLMNRAIDSDLETIVLRCLSKEPARRYQSAGDLTRDLGHYLSGMPIEARRDSTLYVLLKNARRYRWALITGITFLIVLAGFAVHARVQAGQQRALAQREHAANEAAQTAKTRAVAAQIEADGQRQQASAAQLAESAQRQNAQHEAQRAQAV